MLAKLRKLAGDYGFTGLGRSGPKPLNRGKHKFRKVSSASLPAKIPRDPSPYTVSRPRQVARHGLATINHYYSQTGQMDSDIIPSMNACPHNDFWKHVPGQKKDTDTVDHKRMLVSPGLPEAERYSGEWHVKTPGHESTGVKLKRYLQKMMYWITGQRYKADYYDNKQLLAQKEVLAANVYREVVGTESDDHFNSDYQVAYSMKEAETSSGEDEHCIASRHLQDYESGYRLVQNPSDRSSPVHFTRFHKTHNPVVDLIVRRFLLGDEDYLKLDNYMFIQDSDRQKQSAEEEARQRLVNIDFGMSFYNRCQLPSKCTLAQFRQKMMSPSIKHRSQYRGRHTMHTVIKAMERSGEDIDALMTDALGMIARMSDEKLNGLVGHVHHPQARSALLRILKFKRDQAAAIIGPESHDWPEEPGRMTLSALVGRVRRT
ncbi:hypothetical protein NX722_13185 [Endozoicomonas gorgoniicola]|uniref:Uncharacterized protein n=1 Tax=Endozoicomonas gorgoniicola TaxID=1234144 RepID=A0ABT3MW09_9GAMM|nr:hypothetical protein [Endozoicomonas gorgoniicola]MCW7553562.1 hypothetical protein [Endozoicomonas gorgoniicola]